MKTALKRITYVVFIIMIMTLMLPLVPFNQSNAATVKLSKSKVTITVANTYTLKVNNVKKGIKWSSSKKSIATVNSNGKVTGKKKGSAIITAKVNGKMLKCRVTVKSSAPTLNKTNITLAPYETYKLTASGNGSSKVTWSTSNESIADITSKGTVSGERVGITTIKAKMNGLTIKCKVTVQMTIGTTSSPYDPTTGITMHDGNYGLSNGVYYYQLAGACLNSNAVACLNSIGENGSHYESAANQFNGNLIVLKYYLSVKSGYSTTAFDADELVKDFYYTNFTSKAEDWYYLDLNANNNLDSTNVSLYNGQSSIAYAVYIIPKDMTSFYTFTKDSYGNKQWVQYNIN